jgi:hypothetical protein
LTELLERLIENAVGVLGNVELYLDVSDDLHTSSVCLEIPESIYSDVGSHPCHRAWFVSSVVGFLPDLKGRGIRLAISMNSYT